MSNFDQSFESTRLAMLAQQHPEIVKVKEQIIFNAEEDEDRLSGTSWKLEEDIFDKITESVLKFILLSFLITSLNIEDSTTSPLKRKELSGLVMVCLILSGYLMAQQNFK